ncbi:MAG: hypothetical protein H6934_08215 [Burkholderiaceae bacterium]|nr:hypothetical protein [Burkholderiaceae bacterium]
MPSSENGASAPPAPDQDAQLDELLWALPSPAGHGAIGGRPAVDAAADTSADSGAFIRHWSGTLSRVDPLLGSAFARCAPALCASLSKGQVVSRALAALDAFERMGRDAAIRGLGSMDESAPALPAGPAPARLAELQGALHRFVLGLGGRAFEISPVPRDEPAWTDSDCLHLPASVARFDDPAANASMYRCLATLLWGFWYYGSFRNPPPASPSEGDGRFLDWLGVYESLRIEARIGSELPGLANQLAQMRGPLAPALLPAMQRLESAAATVADSYALASASMRSGPEAAPVLWPLRLDPAIGHERQRQRIERDRAALAAALRRLGEQTRPTSAARAAQAVQLEESDEVGGFALRLDDIVVPASAEVVGLVQSLRIDTGALPTTGPAPEATSPLATRTTHNGPFHDPPRPRVPPSPGESSHEHEWDFRRQQYLADWCRVLHRTGTEGDAGFVAQTRRRHRRLIEEIRRRFERIRQRSQPQRRCQDGDEIDLDAQIEAFCDRRAHASDSNAIYVRRSRHERSLAVMFAIDMSGSTHGWVNDAQRSALLILGEAIERLGDRWAVYGFSSDTRQCCELFRIKDFGESFDARVERRIAGIDSRGYTRMGFAIRRLGNMLATEDSRHRLLVTLTDGKPDDRGDDYRGRYGIEDTRRAMQELHAKGLRCYGVTFDRQARQYLDRLYGPAGFTVIADVATLPARLSDIYRRVTS